MVLSHDGFCFVQCGEPPLNLKMFVSGNAFDNSMFFYEQLKLTWLGRVVIPIDFGREIDTASWYPIALDDTLQFISPVLPAP